MPRPTGVRRGRIGSTTEVDMETVGAATGAEGSGTAPGQAPVVRVRIVTRGACEAPVASVVRNIQAVERGIHACEPLLPLLVPPTE
jgi:hypothetical protein